MLKTNPYSLLQTIHSPADLRRLQRDQLGTLATELRAYLLESVSKTGGHLSSNLGTVELTVALHYVFNTPHDRVVWDVGHQTYPHKILTGRRERMTSLRQLGGLSGFPQRAESEFDAFGTAHSSTSISAALGMALASRIKGEERQAIAVIGDGAMTAGMAFEAMNNAGVSDCNLLVILNDNDMSISPPVGALNRYLAKLMSGQFYATAKNAGKSVLKGAPPLFELARRFEESAKGMVKPITLFEKFGFNYVGPIDGHDVDTLVSVLENIKHPSIFDCPMAKTAKLANKVHNKTLSARTEYRRKAIVISRPKWPHRPPRRLNRHQSHGCLWLSATLWSRVSAWTKNRWAAHRQTPG